MPDSSGSSPSRYREVTVAAIVFGVVVGTVMNAAITYAGLKIGFTIVGSSIAAVLGFGVLRGVMRKGTILEINIGQTVGSAVNTPNSGVIFTVPVLLLIGIPLTSGGVPNANFWLVALACVTGAILGCAFIVPLRKQMLDIERLRFPSATAVGEILKSPGAGTRKAILLVVSILVAAALAAPHQLHLIKNPADLNDLDELVYAEKIGFEDKLRTEMIAGWIEDRSAPPEVVAHGRALAGDSAEEDVDTARETAHAAVAEATARGPYRVTKYPDELALRVARIVDGERSWDDLRSKKAGWATRPMLGYADLEVRMDPEVDESAGTVDYAYDGLGDQDPVLTPRVDRDRNGRPDRLIDNTKIDAGRMLGLPDYMQLLFALAPFALGAGYLTGRPGLFVLAGGVLAYLILNPILYALGWLPASIAPHGVPGFAYDNINRPLGIGLLIGGALMGVLASLPSIRAALKGIVSPKAAKAGRDELGLKPLVATVVLGTAALFATALYVNGLPVNTTDPVSEAALEGAAITIEVNGYVLGFESSETAEVFEDWSEGERTAYLESVGVDRPGILARLGLGRVGRALVLALIGAVWIWFAGIIIAQCTGMTDWSPISGMSLITVVIVLVLGGVGDQLGAVMIGAALCVAITCAADMMADLKTGYIVGAQPRRQQIVELVATGIGPVISMAVLLIIASANIEAYGVPIGKGTDTVAPQAQALQAVIEGVRGEDMPYALYGLGAIAGLLLGLGSFSGLGVLVGISMYLPIMYLTTYGIGCILNVLVGKVMGRTWAEEWGVPVAAGFIVGDALLGLSVNLIVLLQG